MTSTSTMPAVNAQRLLDTFLDLVKLDSPSGDEGLVRDYLIEQFKALSIPYTVDEEGNIIAQFTSNQPQPCCSVIVTGHMDVVPPCHGVKPQVTGEGLNRLVTTDGTTVLGADDKSALAAFLEATRLSIEHNTARPNTVFLITVREETFLEGAKAIDPKHYQHCDFGFTMDHTGPQGTIVYQAAQYEKFTITVTGKSVHAGIMPEKGINAITLLSRLMTELPLGRLDEDTTANWGFIKGGKATNIVPDLATLTGEIRSHNPQRITQFFDDLTTKANAMIGSVEGASFNCDITRGFDFYHTPLDNPHLLACQETLKTLNLPVSLIRSNGGSDINVFTQAGVPGIVLSAGYLDPHTLDERVSLKDMVTMTEIIVGIWQEFSTIPPR